jgi:hypothetical protein
MNEVKEDAKKEDGNGCRMTTHTRAYNAMMPDFRRERTRRKNEEKGSLLFDERHGVNEEE